MIRGSLIVDGHNVWYTAERVGNALSFTPLHTDAPESEHGVVLARFAELVQATFFAEEVPKVPYTTTENVVQSLGSSIAGAGPESEWNNAIPAQQDNVQQSSDINDTLDKLDKETTGDGSTTADAATDA